MYFFVLSRVSGWVERFREAYMVNTPHAVEDRQLPLPLSRLLRVSFSCAKQFALGQYWIWRKPLMPVKPMVFCNRVGMPPPYSVVCGVQLRRSAPYYHNPPGELCRAFSAHVFIRSCPPRAQQRSWSQGVINRLGQRLVHSISYPRLALHHAFQQHLHKFLTQL